MVLGSVSGEAHAVDSNWIQQCGYEQFHCVECADRSHPHFWPNPHPLLMTAMTYDL